MCANKRSSCAFRFIPALIFTFIHTPTAQNCGGGYYPFNGSCYPIVGSDVGNNYYYNYNSNTGCINGACYPAGTSLSNNNGINCINAGTCFYSTNTNNNAASSYSFTTSSCSPNTVVGSVSYNGASTFTMSSSNNYFYVTNAGQIVTSTTVPIGTYFLTITGYGLRTVTIPVTITVTGCSNSNTSGAVCFTNAGLCFFGK